MLIQSMAKESRQQELKASGYIESMVQECLAAWRLAPQSPRGSYGTLTQAQASRILRLC